MIHPEKLGGERHESDGKQECQVNPGKANIGTAQVIELRLLTHPENSQSKKTHEVDENLRREGKEFVAEFVLVVDQFGRGDTEVDGKKGHGHAENAVAQSGEAFDALAGNAVVGSDHFVARKRWRSLEVR